MKTEIRDRSATPAAGTASGRSALTGGRKEILPREKQILKMVAEGLYTKQIARRIGLGEEMVKTHMKYMFHITGTNSRSALVAWAFRTGVLT
jgi:DNA-binding CsgD family transcriptional regulator